jgi:hypothetical protein
MEYIEDDVVILQKNKVMTLISKKRLVEIYVKERDRIEALGIKIIDSGSDLNIVWSESRAKMYFIDLERWDFSEMHITKQNKL